MLILSLADQGDPGVIYKSNDNLWHCCGGSEGPNCTNPTDETFNAPLPSSLQTYNHSASTSSDSGTSKSLSSVTAGGIGASVTIAVCLSVVAIYFLLKRRKKTARREDKTVQDISTKVPESSIQQPGILPKAELDAQRDTSELPT
jgi:hypothetical protein